MSVFHENMLIGSSGQGGAAAGYNVERSLRFSSSDSAFCSRTPSTAGNRKTWTWAGWVKRVRPTWDTDYLFGAYYGGTLRYEYLTFTSSDRLEWFSGLYDIDGTTTSGRKITSAVFRDVSAWYHVVAVKDTTQATAANRFKLYVNGVQILLFDTSTDPALNAESFINDSSTPHRVGGLISSANSSQYLADVFFIDGQALDPSSFTEVSATTGQLIPKAYTGTFTGNSFWLKFADNSAATATTLGKDSSGLGNNWTPNNLSVTAGAGNDSLVDTPTSYGTDTGAGGSVRGNYCTWNPLTGAITLTNGNLDGNSTGGAWRGATGTAGVLSGKWYWESTIQNTDSGNYYGEFGFIKTTDITGAITFPSGMNGIVYYARNGRKISGGTSVVTSSSGATTGDVVQVAVDLDAGKIWFGVNNTWIDSGNPASGTNAAYTGLSGTYLPVIGVLDGGKCNTNWGARPFAYTAPSGFKALCDTNLPAPVVAKPSTAMDVKLYTGNGGTQTISGLGFSPDLVWLKSRSGAYNHRLVDRVQGNTSTLASNLTAAAVDCSNDFTGFTNDGFSLNQTVDFELNRSSTTYVAWAWDAGSTTVTNTQGSITSQVRANASAGFSVVTYTGTGGTGTVGHGLGVAPSMIIVKNRSNAVNWAVAHAGIDSNRCLNLNRDVDASTVGFLGLDKSSFASTTFTVNYSDTSTTVVNGSSNNYVAYCFAPVAGYSAFGSYTGNGSSDGPFVYTGFRPKWVMIKGISGGDHWYLYDSVRLGYNPRNEQLTPNLSDAEYDALSYPNIDICANGFKLRTTIGGRNSSGVLYAYAAFAESPFAYARAR